LRYLWECSSLCREAFQLVSFSLRLTRPHNLWLVQRLNQQTFLSTPTCFVVNVFLEAMFFASMDQKGTLVPLNCRPIAVKTRRLALSLLTSNGRAQANMTTWPLSISFEYVPMTCSSVATRILTSQTLEIRNAYVCGKSRKVRLVSTISSLNAVSRNSKWMTLLTSLQPHFLLQTRPSRQPVFLLLRVTSAAPLRTRLAFVGSLPPPVLLNMFVIARQPLMPK
jgi:hypothetical protein